MKLSNLSVIFIVVAIPLILLLSYYISLQRDTINLQTSYNTKLLESTKEAIEAFEINTVEWNEAYSETEDSKRRDIMAAINTFTTSLANNLGVSGTSKEFLLTNIPAVAFTLYDGCYIYTPSATKFTVKDENGVTQFMSEELAVSTGYKTASEYNKEDDGKILYEVKDGETPDGTFTDANGNSQYFTLNPTKAKTTDDLESQDYPHILKPFTAYTEILQDNWIISYTLDNYVTVYGEIDEEYTSRSGYLNVTSSSVAESSTDNGIYIADNDFINNTLNEIYFSGMHIQPELLSETIAYKYKEDGIDKIKTGTFNYVYEAEKDTKIYYDGEFFRLNNDLEKVYIKDLTEPLYKKCTIPTKKLNGEKTYIKAYQSLVDGTWYLRNNTGTYILVENGDSATEWDEKLYSTDSTSPFYNKLYDYSAINYCVESYDFTNWVNNLELKVRIKDEDENLKSIDSEILKINKNNDPEDEESKFTKNKKEIIKSVVISNLNQAITSYSKNSTQEYKLPMLKETEWDQVLSNVSIITFLQNIPIGLKYYNNYAIATSTLNKEYVDPDEIYIYDQDSTSDAIYHSPYCSKLETTNNLIGYRSIDYIYKYYQNENKETKYYFRHSDETDRTVNQSCYYCLIQRALYEKTLDVTIEQKHKDAYYTALARERYLQLDSITIEKSDINVIKTVDKTEVSYGDIVKYTIMITNNGTVNDYISIRDFFKTNQLELLPDSITVNERTSTCTYTEEEYGGELYSSLIWEGIEIGALGQPNSTIKIEFEAIVIGGNIGNDIVNTVGVYSYSTDSIELDHASTNSRITKTVGINAPDTNEARNIVLVLDHSNSMDGIRNGVLKYKLKCLYNGVNIFLNEIDDLFNNEESQLSIIHFNNNSSTKYSCINSKSDIEEIKGKYNKSNPSMFLTGAGTNYNSALAQAETEVQKMSATRPENKNIVIFFTDGMPTRPAGLIGYAIQPNGDYKFEIIGGFGEEVDTKYGDRIWLNGYDSYEGIQTIAKRLKTQRSTEIYCINCTNNDTDTKYGLKNVISSGEEKHYMTGDDEETMTTAFKDIADSIIPVNVQAPNPKSYGTIELDKVSKITAIYVGAYQLNSSELQSIKDSIQVTDDRGILNLNEFSNIFHREGDITVVY